MSEVTTEKRGATVELSGRSVFLAGLTGLFVGSGIWLLTLALQNWVITPLFCHSIDLSAACDSGYVGAFIFAQIILHMVGLFILVNLGVYRPLLVIIASITALHGIDLWLAELVWYEAAVWFGLVYALAYVFFAWLGRIASFALTLVLFAATVVGIRYLMTQL